MRPSPRRRRVTPVRLSVRRSVCPMPTVISKTERSNLAERLPTLQKLAEQFCALKRPRIESCFEVLNISTCVSNVGMV